jgi:hypothetical protein
MKQVCVLYLSRRQIPETRQIVLQLNTQPWITMQHKLLGSTQGFTITPVLPDVSTPEEIKQDALAQAQKVVWRLASMGGYSDRDLPYALDLENKCVRYSSTGACQKNATRSAVTLWALTFLASLKEKTAELLSCIPIQVFLKDQ